MEIKKNKEDIPKRNEVIDYYKMSSEEIIEKFGRPNAVFHNKIELVKALEKKGIKVNWEVN